MKIKKELTMSGVKIQLYLFVPSALAAALLVLLPYWVNGEAAYEDWTIKSRLVHIAACLLGIVVHEALHGFTWMKAGNLRISDISYGFIWKALMPFAHSKKPLTKRAYQLGAVMPCLVLGVVPYLLSFIFPSPELMYWGMLFIVVAAGDAWILWTIRKEPVDALILDHPNKPGCYIIEPEGSIQTYASA